MSHRLDGHDPRRLRFLLLIKALNIRVLPHCEIGCFDKRPAYIRVAILGIALAFACAIAEFGAVHATTIGGPLAHGGKAVHVTGFEHDGQGQGLANPGHGEYVSKGRAQGDSGLIACAIAAICSATQRITARVLVPARARSGVGSTSRSASAVRVLMQLPVSDVPVLRVMRF